MCASSHFSDKSGWLKPYHFLAAGNSGLNGARNRLTMSILIFVIGAIASNVEFKGVAPASEIAQMTREVDFAYSRFEKLCKVRPGKITIDIRPEPSNSDKREMYLAWTTADGFRQKLKASLPEKAIDGIVAKIQDARPLSHEVGHILHGYYVQQLRAASPNRPKISTYGSGFTHDWIEEAAAISCETEKLRQNRHQEAKSNLNDLVPLSKLMEMSHPVASLPDFKPSGKTGIRVITTDSLPGNPSAFYAQISVFLEYLDAKVGPGYLPKLVKADFEGKTKEEQLNGIGLKGSLDSVDKDFREWLAKPGR